MMRTLMIADIVLGGAAAVAIIATYQFLWVPLSIAVFRQRLFRLRRDLFLYAANGNIGFNAPAYLQLNDSINSLIGFADKVTVLEALLCAMLVGDRLPIVDVTADVINAIEDERVRRDLAAIHQSAQSEIIRHLALTSPLFWIISLPMGLFYYRSLRQRSSDAPRATAI